MYVHPRESTKPTWTQKIAEIRAKAKGCQLIHYFYWHSYINIMKSIPELANVPHLVSVHHLKEYKLARPMELTTNFISTMSVGWKRFIEYRIEHKEKIKVELIPGSVDMDLFKKRPTNFRKQFKLPADSIIIGIFGALEGRKGLDYFFPAFYRLGLKYSQLYLLLMGFPPRDGHSTKMMNDNLQRIKGRYACLLEGDFRNPKYTHPQISEAMNAIDIYCCPSLTEGGPLTILEAMATKVPVVCTNNSGMGPDIIASRENGVICQTRNDKDLENALEFLIGYPQRMKEIGIKGYESVKQFNIYEVAKKADAVYIKIFNHWAQTH